MPVLCTITSTIAGLKCVFNQQLVGTEIKLVPSFGFGTIPQFTVVIFIAQKTFIVYKNAGPSSKTLNQKQTVEE